MAPQPQQNDGSAQEKLQQQMRQEDADARAAPDGDAHIERGETLAPHQDQNDDSADTGLVRQEPIKRSPHDDARAAIANRFRRTETPEDERPFNNDFTSPENLYGEFGRDPDEGLTDEEIDARAAEAEARGEQPARKPQQQQDQQTPRMITRTVRGKQVTKSEDEWLADAAKVTAADSYLEEARALLQEAKEIRKGRALPEDRQHPDGHQAREELDPPNPDGDQHQDPTYEDVVRKIQFGDPEEAARDLEKIVVKQSTKATETTALQRAYDQDLARSKKELKAFSDANPDIAADEIAAMAIERGMYKGYREDIEKLGIDPNQIPKTPNELANWHRFYRTHGFEVRSTKDLLENSKTEFLRWKNGGRNSADNPQPSRKAQPKVQINLNRDERRMAIPVQPTRGVAPRRDAQPAQRPTGSDVVAQMRRARGQV